MTGGKIFPGAGRYGRRFLDEWPELEPTLLEFVGILADGMSAAVPVISNLAQSILPSLISTLGTLFDAAGPVLSVIGDLAQGKFCRRWPELSASWRRMRFLL